MLEKLNKIKRSLKRTKKPAKNPLIKYNNKNLKKITI